MDLPGFYGMLMDVMRFSVGFFLHDFHVFFQLKPRFHIFQETL